jgi:hypothetical protein
MEDEPIYQDEVVTVTRTRFVVRSQTYVINGITSVSNRKREANRVWPTVMAAAGAIILFGGLSGGGIPAIVAGAIVGGLGVFWYRSLSVQYEVVLTTEAGETAALTSDDEDWISRVTVALNKAIVARG